MNTPRPGIGDPMMRCKGSTQKLAAMILTILVLLGSSLSYATSGAVTLRIHLEKGLQELLADSIRANGRRAEGQELAAIASTLQSMIVRLGDIYERDVIDQIVHSILEDSIFIVEGEVIILGAEDCDLDKENDGTGHTVVVLSCT